LVTLTVIQKGFLFKLLEYSLANNSVQTLNPVGEQSYEHYMGIKEALSNNASISESKVNIDENSNAGIEYYYWYDDEKKQLDYVLIGYNYFEVVESL
jgi:hypothetical protein